MIVLHMLFIKTMIVSSKIFFYLVCKPFLPSRTSTKSTEANIKNPFKVKERALSDIGGDVASVEPSALFSPYQISGVLDVTQQMQDLLQLANLAVPA